MAGVITRDRREPRSQLVSCSVGGLRGAARRVGLAMTDQELLPTARNIPDNGEPKDDRNRRGIEALMTRLETELGQQGPQKKGESLEMFFASNKLQRKRGERITDCITRFEESIKTLQGNEINLTIDDVPGWMLMRKASLTQERRERLIAALPDEHFAINDVKRVLLRLFPELHINEHRESDGHSRRSRNDHTGPSSAYQRREQTSYPRRHLSTLATGHEWADTGSVDDETDVNSADLQGFVRSELEALSAGVDDFSQRSFECFYSRRVLKVGECGNGIVLCPGSVGNHPCIPRQDEGQERRQRRTCSLIFWKGQGKVAKTQFGQTFAGQISCEKVEVNVSRVWTTSSLGW